MANSLQSLNALAQMLPAATRKKVYQWVRALSGLATLVLLLLPALPSLGITLPPAYLPALTAVLTLLSHLAAANTHPEPLLDLTEAPEPGDVRPPAGVADPALNEAVLANMDKKIEETPVPNPAANPPHPPAS